MTGIHICLEGVDGSGKSTLLKGIIQELDHSNITHHVVKMIGEGKIREMVLFDESLTPKQRMLLYKVAAETARIEIEKAKQQYDVVLCERGEATFIAYQGAGDDLLYEVKTILSLFDPFPLPDLTFYLQIPVELMQVRLAGRSGSKDVFEQKDLKFFERVDRTYRREMAKLISGDYSYVHFLDGVKSPEELVREAVAAIKGQVKKISHTEI